MSPAVMLPAVMARPLPFSEKPTRPSLRLAGFLFVTRNELRRHALAMLSVLSGGSLTRLIVQGSGGPHRPMELGRSDGATGPESDF